MGCGLRCCVPNLLCWVGVCVIGLSGFGQFGVFAVFLALRVTAIVGFLLVCLRVACGSGVDELWLFWWGCNCGCFGGVGGVLACFDFGCVC